MIELHVVATPRGPDALEAGYVCPCGCTPATTYRRGGSVATEGCCCGNQFAVGPDASDAITMPEGYALVSDTVPSPWGQPVPVAWAIGPSTHDEGHGTETGGPESDKVAGAIDPVCGMTVDPEAARAKGLHSAYRDKDHFFCGKGCKLEFDEDPEQYLRPDYQRSM